MNSMENNVLRVPGANLYYEIRGSGPLFLLIHGGGGNTFAFDGIVDTLAGHYTVVTYDRRGLSHSTLDDPQEEQLVETHSHDAHLLLKALGTDYEPAYVFGSSGGAIVGLDLAARYPAQVKMLIAHEPPSHLLPEADAILEMAAVREVYLREGAIAAFQKLTAQPGLDISDREADLKPPRMPERGQAMKDLSFLLEHEFAMYDRYQFDFTALRKVSGQVRLILAGGCTSRGCPEYRSAVAIADQLETTLVEFPGNHIGYTTHPRAFAEQLLGVLGEAQHV
jgi:pimeloyl-ACP methyl ester carboxylesterase